MRSVLFALVATTLLLGPTSLLHADDLVGIYEGSTRGQPLIVRVNADDGAYSGTIRLNDKEYPFTAKLTGGALKGNFISDANEFPFTISFADDRTTLSTGDATYALTRAAAAPAARQERPAAGQAAAGQPMVFTKYTLIEPAERIKVAHWLMPKGWKVVGGVVWRHNRVLYATYNLRIYNPDGLEQLRGIPAEVRSTPTQPGQQGIDFEGVEYSPLIQNPADYITQIAIPQHCRDLPQYKVVGYEPLPKLAAKAEQLGKQDAQNGVAVSAVAGRLRVAYQLDGKDVEEDFYCSLLFYDFRAQWRQLGLANGPIKFAPNDLYSIRAEKGRVDEITPVLHATIGTMHEDIQMFALRTQIDQIRARGAAERAEVRRQGWEKIRRTQLEITDIITQGYKERVASQERIQRQHVDAIRGIDRYVDPSDPQTEVQLPTGYEKAWSNGLGEYILSNDLFFDPNQNSSQTWEQMKHAKN
jgi:hypothetical protein